MPLASSQILEHFAASRKAGRLAHTFLVTAREPKSISGLVLALAEKLLGQPTAEHPDFFRVRPESKSRRITVEQIRDLEKSLYLKPLRAPVKMAWIEDADRMCLGQAEPANAFLKTLEEPPASTIILLSSTRPQVLLPTILSRCVRLDLLEAEAPEADPAHDALWKSWVAIATPGPMRAYARARLLSSHWQELHEVIEESVSQLFTDSEDVVDDVIKALVESEFQLARQQTVASLQRSYWNMTDESLLNKRTAILALEQLQQSLQQNMEQNLAIDRACLAIEGLI
jgi:DNA polymerase-3 subunit delta'